MHEPTGRSGLAIYGASQGYSVQEVYLELKNDYKPRYNESMWWFSSMIIRADYFLSGLQ